MRHFLGITKQRAPTPLQAKYVQSRTQVVSGENHCSAPDALGDTGDDEPEDVALEDLPGVGVVGRGAVASRHGTFSIVRAASWIELFAALGPSRVGRGRVHGGHCGCLLERGGGGGRKVDFESSRGETRRPGYRNQLAGSRYVSCETIGGMKGKRSNEGG